MSRAVHRQRINEKDTLKSWTVLETIMGFTAFGVAALLSLVV